MEEELQQVQEVYTLVTTFMVTYSFQIVGALIILLLGILLARKVGRLVEKLLVRHKVGVTLSRFTGAGVKILLIVLVAIIALGKLGVSVTPFVATVGALSLGAGLALQGMLSNYAAGVAIIVTHPFVVGDTITVQGVTGVVKSVQLGYTVVCNEDEVRIIIPNKHIVGEIIHNSTTLSIVESTLNIAYHCDPHEICAAILDVLGGVDGVSMMKPPQVGIETFGENGITLGIRFWVRTEVLFQSKYLAHARIHRLLKDKGVEMALPQREVRLLQDGVPDAAAAVRSPG